MRILHIANGDDCLGSAKCLYELLEYENIMVYTCSNYST